jgi:hypothetical protein
MSYLETPTDVKSLLEDLMHMSIKARMYNSTLDLRTLGLSDSTVEVSLSSEKNPIKDYIPSSLDFQ